MSELDPPYDYEQEVHELPEQQRRITWFRSKLTNEFYFRVQGDNYKTVAASEGYKDKRDMFDTIEKYFPEWTVIENEV